MPPYSRSSGSASQTTLVQSNSPYSSGGSDYSHIFGERDFSSPSPSPPAPNPAPAPTPVTPRGRAPAPPPPPVPNAWSTKGLEQLGGKDQMNIIDLFEKMRNSKVSKHVSLPQLIVCGDQSSGKSSVLQAIAGIPFPHSSVQCTRFATEVVLRRAIADSVSVSIRPYDLDSWSPPQRARLESFGRNLNNINDIHGLISGAGEYMSFNPGSGFSRDVLQIEIAGPTQIPLILVDLPGLIRNGPDVAVVEELVDEYMRNPRSTILVVISAASDFDLQGVLDRAKLADPGRRRTLGIITKPDKLDRGLASERTFVRLAQNEYPDMKFHLGWHVLMNGHSADGNNRVNFEQRDAEERAFLQQAPWSALGSRNLGVAALRIRLSDRLLEHVKRELKDVKGDIESAISKCEKELADMGEPHLDTPSQRNYLNTLGKRFNLLCIQAVWGNYTNADFFGTGFSEEYQDRYLRAVIRNYNDEFAETLCTYGHELEVSDYRLAPRRVPDPESDTARFLACRKDPIETTREEAITSWVKPVARRVRGQEVGDGRNSVLVKMLFGEQSKKWKTLATQQLNDCSDACRRFLTFALEEVSPETLRSALHDYIDARMNEKYEAAKKELKDIIYDCECRFPNTGNYQFAEEIDRAREIRTAVMMDDNGSLERPTPEYMRCETSLDETLAYYKIARRRFVDDVVVQVVERRLLGELCEVFSGSEGMSDETVNSITEESQENQYRRKELGERLKSLLEGAEICRKYMRR